MASDTGDGPTSADDGVLSSDEMFDLLSHPRRRYVLECLDRYGSPMSLPDLADECVALEHDRELESIPAETVKRMYMSLYHSHIPKLVDAGVVWYDQESDSVIAGPNASQLDSHLGLATSAHSPAVKSALETLRPHLTAADDGLSTERARSLLRRAGNEDDEVVRLLRLLEDEGYVYILDGRVRLTG